MSARSSSDGSSSTTMAMFCIALRNRRGMDASASATSCSNSFRSTPWGRLFGFLSRRLAVARPRDDEPKILAVVAHDALVAERLRAADAAAVKNQRVGCARPALRRQRGRQLLFHQHRIVSLGDADAVR